VLRLSGEAREEALEASKDTKVRDTGRIIDDDQFKNVTV
jgi:hypothetical protein